MKKIVSVQYPLPVDRVQNVSFRSDRSLLDADIVVFEPSVRPYQSWSYKLYQGRPLIDEGQSFRLKEDSAHWRREIRTAVEAGKTVFIYLRKPEDVFVHTGAKEFSGTGRSRVETNYVDSFNTYACIPLELGQIIPSSGREIALVKEQKAFASYWREFGPLSSYQVYFEQPPGLAVFRTKTADKPVGLLVRSGKGLLVLLPHLQYWEEEYDEESAEEEDDQWSEGELRAANRLVAELVGLDAALRAGQEMTAPPPWAADAKYASLEESEIERQIAENTTELESVQARRDELLQRLSAAQGLKGLLYEQGRPLERAVLQALRLMGFQAEPFRDAESEFDAVFVSPEGRCLGEAEGRDAKAVGIDKFSQLERNLHEDFARDEVTQYAKGVLFANGHRLAAPEKRSEHFTSKCIAGAKRTGMALVRTSDLYFPAVYLKSTHDEEYAAACRNAIFNTAGDVVAFPKPPETGSSQQGTTRMTPAKAGRRSRTSK